MGTNERADNERLFGKYFFKTGRGDAAFFVFF